MTEAFDIMEFFDKNFKFSVGQSLRHKADKKEYGTNDMGLLVLKRLLIQSEDTNALIFKRQYICRLIKYSGSGDTALFDEHELQTIEDWRRNAIDDEHERNLMRKNVDELEKDILTQYGIEKGERFKLKDQDSTKEFRQCGFKSSNNKYVLLVRESNTLATGIESIEVSDKDLIIHIS